MSDGVFGVFVGGLNMSMRPPDRGDAVVMAFTRGQDNAGWQATDPNLREIRVNRGHEAKKRYLRG